MRMRHIAVVPAVASEVDPDEEVGVYNVPSQEGCDGRSAPSEVIAGGISETGADGKRPADADRHPVVSLTRNLACAFSIPTVFDLHHRQCCDGAQTISSLREGAFNVSGISSNMLVVSAIMHKLQNMR